MRFTPGMSPGEAATCDQATVPSGPTITIARSENPLRSYRALLGVFGLPPTDHLDFAFGRCLLSLGRGQAHAYRNNGGEK